MLPLSRPKWGCRPRSPWGLCPPCTPVLPAQGTRPPLECSAAVNKGPVTRGCSAPPDRPYPSRQVARLPPALHPGPSHLPPRLLGTGQAFQVSAGLVSSLVWAWDKDLGQHVRGRCHRQRGMRVWPGSEDVVVATAKVTFSSLLSTQASRDSSYRLAIWTQSKDFPPCVPSFLGPPLLSS